MSTMQDIVVTVTTPGTPVQLSATPKRVGFLCLTAKKADGGNAGNIFIGLPSVDQSSRQTLQMLPLDYWEPQISRGESIDLSDLWLDAAVPGDGVIGLFQEA